MASTQITDLHGVPYDFDADRRAMGVSVADDVQNRSGVNDPAVAETQYRPTAAPRVLPVRVRRQRLIDAASGRAIADDVNARLGRDLDDRLATANDDHLARRQRAMGIAVGAHAAFDSPAGYVGSGQRLRPASDRLGPLFGVTDR
jgi:hypothetical protein